MSVVSPKSCLSLSEQDTGGTEEGSKRAKVDKKTQKSRKGKKKGKVDPKQNELNTQEKDELW